MSTSETPSAGGEASRTLAAPSGDGGDELLADLDGDLAEALGLAVVGVADGTLDAADLLDDAGGAVGGLAVDRERVLGLVGPRVGRGLAEVVGEVLRGARVVGAVHRGDVEVGQLDAVGLLVGDRRSSW